jgi:hypothetical protein
MASPATTVALRSMRKTESVVKCVKPYSAQIATAAVRVAIGAAVQVATSLAPTAKNPSVMPANSSVKVVNNSIVKGA